jgi:DNA-directed RNA polymerase subunit M/transcription elongation factor TFIIS
MKFCPDCETYLVTEILNDENTNKILSYKCKNCSYKQVVDISKEPEYKCVYQYNYNLNKTNLDQNTIQYLCNDPTLPHVDNIQCPNLQCIVNKQTMSSEILNSEKNNINLNNVLYIMLNESDLTFLYQCCNCKHTWTNK